VPTWEGTLAPPAKTAEPISMPFSLGYGLEWAQGNMYYGSQIANAKGQLLGEWTCPGMPHDTLS